MRWTIDPNKLPENNYKQQIKDFCRTEKFFCLRPRIVNGTKVWLETVARRREISEKRWAVFGADYSRKKDASREEIIDDYIKKTGEFPYHWPWEYLLPEDLL